MNLTTTEIIHTAIEQRRYPNAEELEKMKIWLKEGKSALEISKIVSEAKDELLNKIRIKLLSKTHNRVSSLNFKNATLEQRLLESLSKYVTTYVDSIDTCLRLTCYSFLSGEVKEILKEIDPKDIPSFLDATGISLKIIFEDFDEIKNIIITKISTEFQDEFLKSFQPISEVILSSLIAQKIYRQALELFENEEETKRWLSTPKTRLGGKTPLEAIETKAGAEKVEEMLYQAEFGMVS
jgi:hypothetical protein